MIEEMFDEPGKKIKTMAKIFFWVEVIACVILAFSLGWVEINRWGDKEFRAGIFFGFLIGGPLASYCSALMLYGFGELVDKIGGMSNRDTISGCAEKNKASESTVVSAPTFRQNSEDSTLKSKNENAAEVKKVETVAFDEKKEVEPIVCDDKNSVKCPSCGLIQARNRNVCWNCGAKFIKPDTESDNT